MNDSKKHKKRHHVLLEPQHQPVSLGLVRLGTMNMCTEFHVKTPDSCRNIHEKPRIRRSLKSTELIFRLFWGP